MRINKRVTFLAVNHDYFFMDIFFVREKENIKLRV